MPNKLRKIKKVQITHISLCPKGANQMETMFKQDGASFEDTRKQVQTLLDNSSSGEDYYVYVRDLFSDSVIYEQSTYISGSRHSGLWKIGYNLETNTLVGDPVEVAERTQYFELNTLAKSDEEEGIIYGVVYSPNLPDSQGDFADETMIKEMMHSFAKEGKGIDITHDFETLSKDDAYVVESFLVQEGDPRFAELKDYDGKEVDPVGSWAVAIKIDDEELRQKYRDGEWKGLSMGGKYQAEEVEEDEVSLMKKAYEMLSKVFGASSQKPKDKPKTGDTEVTPEELAKAVKNGLAEGLKPVKDQIDGLEERLTKVENPEDTKKVEDKVDVDLTDRKAVEARLAKLRKEKLEKEIDISDVEALEKHLATFEDDADPEQKETPASSRTLTKSEAKAKDDLIERMQKMAGLKGE